jgi:hypothetical protein
MEEQYKVWYLPSENKWTDMNMLAMKDSGTLIFKDKSLVFKGKEEDVLITNIQTISYGKQGRDFVNNWVKIEYKSKDNSIKSAFFADKKMLGWSGIFGGTKKLYNKIKKEFKIAQ